MNNKKHTAVENTLNIIEQMKSHGYKFLDIDDIISELYTAKALEREQIEQTRWIPCSEKLPTTFLETYNGTKSNPLVLLDENGNTCIGRFFIQYYDGGRIESFYNEFEDEITGVTHYIELPEYP